MHFTMRIVQEMVIVLGMFLGFAAGAIFAGWHQAPIADTVSVGLCKSSA